MKWLRKNRKCVPCLFEVLGTKVAALAAALRLGEKVFFAGDCAVAVVALMFGVAGVKDGESTLKFLRTAFVLNGGSFMVSKRSDSNDRKGLSYLSLIVAATDATGALMRGLEVSWLYMQPFVTDTSVLVLSASLPL